jgi:hypothetical protein
VHSNSFRTFVSNSMGRDSSSSFCTESYSGAYRAFTGMTPEINQRLEPPTWTNADGIGIVGLAGDEP